MEILQVILIVVEVLVLFNLLIIVHELGHFLAARWRGMVIERFGVWFGKPLWEKEYKGVKYSLGCIPAGGFVALPQMAPMEMLEGASSTPREKLPPSSLQDRIIVAFAGPLFSFLLALVCAAIIWGIGRPVSESDTTTCIGHVNADSPAEKAGLRVGDEILEIDGRQVTRFGGIGSDSIKWRIISSEGQTIRLTVRRNGETKTFEATPRREETKFWERRSLRKLMMLPAESCIVAGIFPNSPAQMVGLQTNDIVLKLNGHPLFSPVNIEDWLQTNGAAPLTLEIKRGTNGFVQQITPEFPLPPAEENVTNTASLFPEEIRNLSSLAAKLRQRQDPISQFVWEQLPEQARQAVSAGGNGNAEANRLRALLAENLTKIIQGGSIYEEQRFAGVKLSAPTRELLAQKPTGAKVLRLNRLLLDDAYPQEIFRSHPPRLGVEWDYGGLLSLDYPAPMEQVRASVDAMVNTFAALFSSKSDVKAHHLSGPVGIFKIYYVLFESPHGWRLAIWFSVIFNVNLALLNLLPIPVLDGGHILLALIEAVRRKAMNMKILNAIQTACATIIIGYMLFITFFDVQDVLPWKRAKEKPPQKIQFAPKPKPQRP